MAKSIRSAIKKRFRSQKRSDRIGVEDQRLARLHARLQARQKTKAAVPDYQKDEEASGDSDDAAIAAVNEPTTHEPIDVEEKKKISTSGSRGSARENWKGGKFLVKKRAKSVLSDRRRKR